MSVTNKKYTQLARIFKGETTSDILEALCTYCNERKMDTESQVIYEAWLQLKDRYVIL